jgi:hypothetical protein
LAKQRSIQIDQTVVSGKSLRRNKSRISNSIEENGSQPGGFMITQNCMKSPKESDGSNLCQNAAINILPINDIQQEEYNKKTIVKLNRNVKENNLKAVKEMVLNSYKIMKYKN